MQPKIYYFNNGKYRAHGYHSIFLAETSETIFFSSLLCYKHFCIGSILTMRIYMKTKHNFIKNSAFVFSDFYLLGFF